MEDIPKNLEKELSRLGGAKSLKKNKRWMLLIVNDHGRVLSFRRFKGLVTLSVLLVVASLFTAAALYFLYERVTRENRQLKNEVALSRKHAETLRGNNEKLTARLVVAESRIEGILAEIEKKTDDMKARPADKVSDAGIESISPPDLETIPAAEPPITEKSAAEPLEAVLEAKPSKVDIGEFRVVRNEEKNRLGVQFKIRNISSGSKPVSGYMFVLLKEREDDPEKWLIYPKVDMVSGKPSIIKKGQHFSIFRFKTVTLNSEDEPPEKVIAATVMVFGMSGELMLEKKFSIDELSKTVSKTKG